MTRDDAIDMLNDCEKYYSELDDEYGYDCYESEQIINRIYDDFEKEPMVEQLNNECIRLRKEVQKLQEEINILVANKEN